MILPQLLLHLGFLMLAAAPGEQTVRGSVRADYYATEAARRAGKPYSSEPPQGTPRAGLRVKLASGDLVAEVSPTDGLFSMRLPVGSHRLTLEEGSFGRSLLEQEIEVKTGEDLELHLHLPLVVPDGPGIRGRVVLREIGYAPEPGDPEPRVTPTVRILAKDGSLVAQPAVDGDGTFYAPVKAQGDYQVELSAAGQQITAGAYVWRDRVQQIGLLTLSLSSPRPHSFQTGVVGVIQVRHPPREPEKGFAVTPLAQTALEVLELAGHRVIARTTTDARGAFAVQTPPGRFELVVKEQQTMRRQLTVESKQVTRIAWMVNGD